MNQWIGMGRLTADPEIRQSQGNEPMTIARFTLAVDRRTKDKQADFIRCIAFGKTAEGIEKWLKKGTKTVVTAHVQTGSYTDKDGNKRSSTDFVIDTWEFAESKSAERSETSGNQSESNRSEAPDDGFVNVESEIDDSLPFS